MKNITSHSIENVLFNGKKNIRVVVITWNLLGSVPPPQQLIKLIHSQSLDNKPDIIYFCTQQCQNSLCASFFYENKSEWEDALIEVLPSKYHLKFSITMQGLHSAIFIHSSLVGKASLENKKYLKAGFCNLIGNKGAIGLQVNIMGQSIQLINCHLAPNQQNVWKRNQTLLRILDEMVDRDSRTQVIICGDFNYRINMTEDQYKDIIASSNNSLKKINYQSFIHRDQLKMQDQLLKPLNSLYYQGQIYFPPTYKLSVFNDEYSNDRIPGWTDRIFIRSGRSRFIYYGCQQKVRGSDHRPVIAKYFIPLEEGLSVFPQDFVGVQNRSCCNII